MFDYVEQLPEGVLKSLLTIVSMLFRTCSAIFEYGEKTLRQIIVELLENLEAPEIIVDGIDTILSGNWAWIYNIALFEVLLGTALIAIVVFGIVKYFTDIVF